MKETQENRKPRPGRVGEGGHTGPQKPKPPETRPIVGIGLPDVKTKTMRPRQIIRGSKPKYDVYIKRFGKYRLVGKKLPYKSAVKIGVKKTAQTAARTLKVVRTGKDAKGEGVRLPSKLAKWYRKGKRGAIIEKTKFAIDTPGERGEITLKGIASIKGRKATKTNFKKIKALRRL